MIDSKLPSPTDDPIGQSGNDIRKYRELVIGTMIQHFEATINSVAACNLYTAQQWWDRVGTGGAEVAADFLKWKQFLVEMVPDLETRSPLIWSTGAGLQVNQDGTVTVKQ